MNNDGQSSHNSSTSGINNEMMLISEDFFDDFDDDDEAFFSLASVTTPAPDRVGGGGAASAASFDGSPPATSGDGAPRLRGEGNNNNYFGMLTLGYTDVAITSTTSLRRKDKSASTTSGRPTTDGIDIFNNNIDEDNDDDITDDVELLELDQRYLSHLRNPNSTYPIVAKSCFALHQLVYNNSSNTNHKSNGSILSSSYLPLQIESSSIYHIQRYQRLVHRILTTLTSCLTSRNIPTCRKLALLTLASTARSSYARLRFDAALICDIHPPSSLDTRLEDECGTEAAHTLIMASLESDDDGVSATALEALGRLTLDIHSDNLSCEIRSIAECANPSHVFMYDRVDEDVTKSSFFLLEHSVIMKELQVKIWERVISPRLLSVLHRLSLYSSLHHVAKALPIVTATLVHALTHGSETKPSRRAMQMTKTMHGKRGWREVDAEMWAKEFVERILLPSLTNRRGGMSDRGVQRALAAACIRMASACPCASWRVAACRHAVVVLLSQLHEEMNGVRPQSTYTIPGLSNKMNESPASSSASSSSMPGIASPLMTASVPMEPLAGTAAMLLVALRGIPLHERASGLASILRATLLYLPHGVPVSGNSGGSPDLPVTTAREGDGREKSYRLGRIGLLTEVALSVMLDGDTSSISAKVDVSASDQNNTTTESVPGVREVLLRYILESDKLSLVWQSFKDKKDINSVNELLWVFCSVAAQLGNKREQLFSKDAASAVEWCNLSLVVLDLFTGIICNPSSSSSYESASPFADAGHAAYVGLFASVLHRCGSFPPSALSISENMLPNSLESNDVKKKSPVVGGPGKQLHQVASSLSKITTKILFLRDKSKNGNAQNSVGTSICASSNHVQLAALLVDAWLGRCIMNHDAKQSNVDQRDMAVMFLPLCNSELVNLLNQDVANADEESVEKAIHLSQVLIACLENVACMSELLAHANAEQVKQGGAGSVGPLAVTMLKGIAISAKEGAAIDCDKDSMIHTKIATDAHSAIVRIAECIRNRPQSYPDDIASTLKVSPLIDNARPRPMPSFPDHGKKVEHCAWFLYCHARLLLAHRTNVAANAVTPTTTSSGIAASSKLVHPRNALRLSSAFSHSTIEMYQKVPNLPMLIPARSSLASRSVTETLTGSSDPVSYMLSHGMRRVRKADLSEGVAFIVTMRLHNITPVPIRNGVRLNLQISQAGGSNMLDGNMCVVSAVYDNEIPAGDYVTWEITLSKWRASNLILQSDVTFLDLEQETSTSKWVSGGGPDEGGVVLGEAVEDEDEAILDVTLPCKPITISPIVALLPCPLVFFAGHNRCESKVGHGDTASFEYLWYCMGKHQHTLSFVIPTDSMEGKSVVTLADTKKGYVTLKSSVANNEDNCTGNPITGCAFIALDGSRIFCKHQGSDANSHTLTMRSDSSYLLESVTRDAEAFLRFIFGVNAFVVQESSQNSPRDKHEFMHDNEQ
ncbi:hypothetical protein ACHAWU_002579 [Discostella pseudostelligera]|uniref:SWIM-type domain-containing protein n=1 Tax=Discostella pseudostelligera TaxID=259834 RepID=A0ABD3LY83_9STRA